MLLQQATGVSITDSDFSANCNPLSGFFLLAMLKRAAT